MNNEEMNKRIHEILGMCWHELYTQSDYFRCLHCKHCNKLFIDKGDENIDFTISWAGFGILWKWWQKHEKFEVFFSKILFDGIATGKRTISQIVAELLSPLALTQATVEFFKEEQK